MIFIVIIIGGLGSVGGCFIGALLMALVANYAGFLAPKLALVSNIVLMIAILLWRPAGLYSKSRADMLIKTSFRRPAAQPRLTGLLLSSCSACCSRPSSFPARVR
jgi:hypothetical protein